MITRLSFLSWAVMLLAIVSCNNSNNPKQLPSKDKELDSEQVETKKHNISTSEAVSMAENQFRKYLPNILETHDAILDIQESYTGDFTGDGIDDVAIYFSLAPKGGGNAIVGQGLSLYQNNGTTVKVIAGYEPDYLFTFDKIANGRIQVQKLEYAENDGRCCPSIKTEHLLTINGSKAY